MYHVSCINEGQLVSSIVLKFNCFIKKLLKPYFIPVPALVSVYVSVSVSVFVFVSVFVSVFVDVFVSVFVSVPVFVSVDVDVDVSVDVDVDVPVFVSVDVDVPVFVLLLLLPLNPFCSIDPLDIWSAILLGWMVFLEQSLAATGW
jgi:hypothetical protein